MRVPTMVLVSAVLAGCASGPGGDAEAACRAQGLDSGTEAFRACVDAGGAAVATGPGSPYANVDEDED